MGSNNNNDYGGRNHCQIVEALKMEGNEQVSSLFEWQRVRQRDNHATAIAHRHLASCSTLDPPVSSNRTYNSGKYDVGSPCMCASGTLLVNRNALQICARCLSPSLGHRRKSKICELCMAKMTYGITNEFSERKLKQRRATLLLNDTASSQSNQWPSLSVSTGLKEPMWKYASSPEDRCSIHQDQPIPRLFSPLHFGSASVGFCPPLNVFPFGDGIVGIKANEDKGENNEPKFQEFNTSGVLPALNVNENPIWRPFDSF
uniref:Expressed conserved protein n=1 Tax=Echinococcus granulosus TaxID=6210 RepID=A0A068WTF3_ECHGR|nr:hypothetical protein EgrG_000524900 [Echinococcus granulosus]